MDNKQVERRHGGRGRARNWTNGRGRQDGYHQNKPGDLNRNKSKEGLHCDAKEEMLDNKKLKDNRSQPTDDGVYCDAEENNKLKDPVSNDVIQSDTNQTSNRRTTPNNTNTLKEPETATAPENNKSGNNRSDVDDSKNVAPINDKWREGNERGEQRRQSEYNHQRNDSKRQQNSRTYERSRGKNYETERANNYPERNNRADQNWRSGDNSHGYEKSGSNPRRRQSEGARSSDTFGQRQDYAGNNRREDNDFVRRGRENTYDNDVQKRNPDGRGTDGPLNDKTFSGRTAFRNGQGRGDRYRGNDRKGNYNRWNNNKDQFQPVPENQQQDRLQSDCNNEVQSNSCIEKENNELEFVNDGKSGGFNVNAKEFVPGQPSQTIDDVENTSAKTTSTSHDSSWEVSDQYYVNAKEFVPGQPSSQTIDDAENTSAKTTNTSHDSSWEGSDQYSHKQQQELSNDSRSETAAPEYSNQEREGPIYDAWNNEKKPPPQLATMKTSRLSGSVGHTDKRKEMPSCKGDTDSSWDTRNVPTLQSNKTTRVSLPDSVRQSKEQTNVTKGRKSMGDSPFGSRSSFNWDKDFEEYDKNYRFKWKRDEDYKVVKEMQQDLFLMGDEYALAHCVAEDLNMGSGIAVSFRQNFKKVDELLKQNQKQGGLAVLHIDDGRYIYYLITKQKSSGKPTLETMFRSVKKLRDHMVEHKVGKLAIPRLGCGLDRLEWSEVKNMLEFLFKGTDIEIVVCNFQQAAEVMQQKNEEHYRRKCKLEHYNKPIIEAEKYTLIIYLGFEDGYVSQQIEGLQKKFNIEREYKATKKCLGSCIEQFQMNKDYVLYGCIVQKNKNDEIHFDHLINCLKDINKKNKKFVKNSEGYDYVALQTYSHKEDSVLMDKIINLARNTLHDITLCIYPE